MKGIILGAGGPGLDAVADARPKCMLPDPRGARVLDWILSSLRQAGITDIAFVGGYRIEQIGEHYPSLRFRYNTEWQRNNVLESLFYAEGDMEGGFVLSYGDIVFRPAVVKALLRAREGDIALVVDRGFRERHEMLSPAVRAKAELVVTREGRIERIGKRLGKGIQPDGEFIGLARFGPAAVEALRSRYHECRTARADQPFHEATSFRDAFLTDMLQELIDRGAHVVPVDVRGGWAEIATPRDLARFVFGTKAETLDRLREVLPLARICEQVSFTVGEWAADPKECFSRVHTVFAQQPVAVRSSALGEDAWSTSMAGAFETVLDVPGDGFDTFRAAVERVAGSYRRGTDVPFDPRNQILVQPMVCDVVMSGVMFTVELETGAPYIVINYDDRSSRTDSVTGGDTAAVATAMIYREAEALPQDERLQRLVKLARRLEAVVGHDALDVEFAFTASGELYVLQVRPIAVKTHREDSAIIVRGMLRELRWFLRDRMRPLPNLPGPTTAFGDMPDWNPAEMIGTRPKPLALSLYQYLITDAAWRIARARVGYADPFGERLMVSLGGHPFVDVRNSFVNLSPAAVPHELLDRLVESYLRRLRRFPHLHDKIEFEIAITCMTFDFDDHAKRLRDDGFSEADVAALRKALAALTSGVVTGRVEPIARQMELVGRLGPRREALLAQPRTASAIPRIVTSLLEDCIEYGTVPFSILARYAFIGSSLLRSMRARGVIDEGEYHAFLEGVRTVAGDLVEEVDRLRGGEATRAEFLGKFGHLRPGTYDILSYRYDERPDLYLPETTDGGVPPSSPASTASPATKRGWAPSEAQRRRIAELVDETGLGCEVDQLLDFIRRAISTREEAKFAFTRNVSDALSLIVELGEAHDINRRDLAYLDARDVVRLATDVHVVDAGAWLRQSIERGMAQYERSHLVRLPTLITDLRDVDVFRLEDGRPNFVTSRCVIGQPAVLESGDEQGDIAGRIVLITSADPGFDWIFMHSIAGLVTMYGGAASHMAIRCAEFGLPAAIGCGETLFSRLRPARRIELNCGAGYVRRIS